MKHETLFVAFATQKGGMGKSTMTLLTASYLHYVKGLNVAVIDCDYSQESIFKTRKREINLAQENDYFKALACSHFNKLQKKAYRILECPATNALTEAKSLLEHGEGHLDIVFFDMPGTLNSEGVISTLASMEYIFVPTSADQLVFESTLTFASLFNDKIVTTGQSNIKEIYLYWTMVDGREKNELYEVFERIINQMGLNFLNTKIPDTKKFRKEPSEVRKTIYRSTLFPMDSAFIKSTHLNEFCDELCSIMKLGCDE